MPLGTVRQIARGTGLGMGTLYRDFPAKDLLLEAVPREDFQSWTRSARQAAGDNTDACPALYAFLENAFLKNAQLRHAQHRAMLERFANGWAHAECTQ